MAALQLMAAHYMFDEEEVGREVFSFDISQKAAYESARKAPIFHGFNKLEVNLEWVLHVLNFFRNHMMLEDGSLRGAFSDLSELEKPSAWKAKLTDGVNPLGRYWRGTYGEPLP